MIKFHRIFLLLIALIFLSTFNPKNLNINTENKSKLFHIKEINILNSILTDKKKIKERLKEIKKKNIFLLKRNEIQELLKDIDFLEKIEVKKKYPNTVEVKVFETTLAGIFFKDKTKYFIDSSSNLVTFNENIKHEPLPNIFGEGGNENFINFFNQLENGNFPIKKIKNLYFFQIGRWDIQLNNEKLIKFPAKNIDVAIQKSIELLNRNDFEKYNTVDLRIDGKIIVDQ